MNLISNIKGKFKRITTPKKDISYSPKTSAPGALDVNLLNLIYFDPHNNNYIFRVYYSKIYNESNSNDISIFCNILSKLGIRYICKHEDDTYYIYFAGCTFDFCALLYEINANIFLDSNIIYSKVSSFLLQFYEIAMHQTIFCTPGFDQSLYPYNELTYVKTIDKEHPIVLQDIGFDGLELLTSVFVYINKANPVYLTDKIIYTFTSAQFKSYLPFLKNNPNYSDAIPSLQLDKKMVYSDIQDNNIVMYTKSDSDQSYDFIDGLDEIV